MGRASRGAVTPSDHELGWVQRACMVVLYASDRSRNTCHSAVASPRRLDLGRMADGPKWDERNDTWRKHVFDSREQPRRS
jgi:hypothetical protein